MKANELSVSLEKDDNDYFLEASISRVMGLL